MLVGVDYSISMHVNVFLCLFHLTTQKTKIKIKKKTINITPRTKTKSP